MVAGVRAGRELALPFGPFARTMILYYGPDSGSIAVVRKSMDQPKKRRGRPVTVEGPVTSIRLTPQLTEKIDRWRERQEHKPRRSEAIRELLEQAVDSE